MNNESEARKTLIAFCRTLYKKGFLPGIDGNLSMRISPEHVLVTPAGVCKGTVTEDELVLVNLAGDVIAGHMKPTSETPMHLAAYVHGKDVGAVIHAHSPNVIAASMAGVNIDSRCAPFAYEHLKTVGEVPYNAPGSATLHNDVTAAIQSGYRAIVLKSHGPMVLGTDMHDAFVKSDLLEAYAGMLIKATLLGGPYVLTDKELAEISGG